MLGLPAPFVPHSASLSPAAAMRVLSTQVPVSAPPTSLDECLFSISLVSVPLAVRFSVSSGCARRRSVSTYAAILVPPETHNLESMATDVYELGLGLVLCHEEVIRHHLANFELGSCHYREMLN